MTTGGWVIWWWHDGLMTQWTDYLMTQWHKASQTIDLMVLWYILIARPLPLVSTFTHTGTTISRIILAGHTAGSFATTSQQPLQHCTTGGWLLVLVYQLYQAVNKDTRIVWLSWYWYWQRDVHHLHRGLDSVFRTRLRIASWHYLHSYPVIRNIQR